MRRIALAIAAAALISAPLLGGADAATVARHSAHYRHAAHVYGHHHARHYAHRGWHGHVYRYGYYPGAAAAAGVIGSVLGAAAGYPYYCDYGYYGYPYGACADYGYYGPYYGDYYGPYYGDYAFTYGYPSLAMAATATDSSAMGSTGSPGEASAMRGI